MPPRVLVLAYSCSPGQGSEPGVGWAWTHMLARHAEVWVMTASRPDRIEAAVGELEGINPVHAVHVEPGRWARRAGRRWPRGHYLSWQVAALRAARRLEAEVGFDLVWHVTFANLWLGSIGGRIGPPFVFGPVGGGARAPWRLLPSLGPRGAVFDAARLAGSVLGKWINPLARSAMRRAERILVMNPETAGWVPRRHRAKVGLMTNSVVEAVPARTRRRGTVALFAAVLEPWKGLVFAVKAVAGVPGWRLMIYGRGERERRRIARLAARLGVADRVDFRGWADRAEILRVMREEADVLLFPSLHDQGAWVIAEALTSGLPVICADRGGPPVIASGQAILARTGSGSKVLVEDLQAALGAVDGAGTTTDRFTPEVRGEEIARILREVLEETGR